MTHSVEVQDRGVALPLIESLRACFTASGGKRSCPDVPRRSNAQRPAVDGRRGKGWADAPNTACAWQPRAYERVRLTGERPCPKVER